VVEPHAGQAVDVGRGGRDRVRRGVARERVQGGIRSGVILLPVLVVVAGQQLRQRGVLGRGVVDRDIDIDGAVHCHRS
jgi:hypothetical protein